MSPFQKRRESVEHVEAVSQELDETVALIRARQPRVNALSAWFTERKKTNGLGRDFEYTFKAKPARGS